MLSADRLEHVSSNATCSLFAAFLRTIWKTILAAVILSVFPFVTILPQFASFPLATNVRAIELKKA